MKATVSAGATKTLIIMAGTIALAMASTTVCVVLTGASTVTATAPMITAADTDSEQLR